MHVEGGCYCGAVRYRADGTPLMKAQCHCRECQYITGGSPNLPDALILKVGTLDDPAQFGGPDRAIFCIDQQGFHRIPEGIPAFERFPG
jgi:hypothetical protein